jgi:hypothetical protein
MVESVIHNIENEEKDKTILKLKMEILKLEKEKSFLQEQIDLTPSMLTPFDDGNNNTKDNGVNNIVGTCGGILYHKTMIELYEQQQLKK